MIKETSHTKDWIQNISNTFKVGKRSADPNLIEKVVKAFTLLESLSVLELDFIFKGGTSLLLLLDKMHRFSIDINIKI